MAWAPTFDGLALDDSNGISWPEWKDHGPVKLEMDGALAGGREITSIHLEGRRITAKLALAASTTGAFDTRLSALLAVLQRLTPGVLSLAAGREIEAYCLPGAVSPGRGSRQNCTIAVEFHAKEPYWRATTQSSAATVNSATTVSVAPTNSGDAPAVPDLEIENTGGLTHTDVTCTIRNATTGYELRLFRFSLEPGKLLHVKADGQVYIQAPSGANSKSPTRLDGHHFDLAPGANSVEFEHNLGTASDVAFRVKWRHAYRTHGEL